MSHLQKDFKTTTTGCSCFSDYLVLQKDCFPVEMSVFQIDIDVEYFGKRQRRETAMNRAMNANSMWLVPSVKINIFDISNIME